MSQHDFTIDNQTFPATRADINSALQALASLSSGASSPSTTFAYQLWVDTTSDPNILNIRNSANNAWIKIGEVNQGSAAFILTAYAILQAGSAAAPSFSFDLDRDTGMYRAAANIIGFATNGTERVRINDSGQAEFSSGTAALPSITTIGDVNTGVFFPAADTIAFAEGGAEAMRINSSGNVGIGETNPTRKLDVVGTASATYFNLGADTASAPAVDAAITRPAGGTIALIANAAERLRIASAGQIGIGGANYGTSGQVLTSGGAAAAPSWASVTSGAYSLISTATASASSSIVFTNLGGYHTLRLLCYNLLGSNTAASQQISLSANNGSTYMGTGTYNINGNWPTSATATGWFNNNSADAFIVTNGLAAAGFYESLITNFNITKVTGIQSFSGGEGGRRIMAGSQDGLTAMNAIKISNTAGTMTSGFYILEGIAG
jgi:hypothetical protein